MRILVVDDEPDVVESVRLGFTLQWREIEVLGAGTGEAALDLVEHGQPDIVLLDVGLPAALRRSGRRTSRSTSPSRRRASTASAWS
jgi:DNA-binding response OmpR family regulator